MRFQSSRRTGVVQQQDTEHSVGRQFARVRAVARCLSHLGDAGATPATCSCTPPFRGTGHDSAKIVGRGSTPLGGTFGLASRRLGRCRIPTPAMQRSIRWRRATCVEVWKPRRHSKPTVIRVRFPIHALSFRLVALTSGRAAVWCDSRWIISGLSTRQLFLGVAQERSTRFGTETMQVRLLSPRRMRT